MTRKGMKQGLSEQKRVYHPDAKKKTEKEVNDLINKVIFFEKQVESLISLAKSREGIISLLIKECLKTQKRNERLSKRLGSC